MTPRREPSAAKIVEISPLSMGLSSSIEGASARTSSTQSPTLARLDPTIAKTNREAEKRSSYPATPQSAAAFCVPADS